MYHTQKFTYVSAVMRKDLNLASAVSCFILILTVWDCFKVYSQIYDISNQFHISLSSFP